MMPSDVTPDLNGNFKRSADGQILGADDQNSYFFGDPSGLLGLAGFGSSSSGNSGSQEGRSQEGQAQDSSNLYYNIAPFIKFRDPKDDFNLGKNFLNIKQYILEIFIKNY